MFSGLPVRRVISRLDLGASVLGAVHCLSVLYSVVTGSEGVGSAPQWVLRGANLRASLSSELPAK